MGKNFSTLLFKDNENNSDLVNSHNMSLVDYE